MSKMRDDISISMDRTLGDVLSMHLTPSIVRIDDYLKSENQNLHVPKLVSIGPFHHCKTHLRKMEQHKWRWLKLLLQRLNESSVKNYVAAIRPLEEQARRCYGDDISVSSYDFVQMLLLDGFFIIELIRKFKFKDKNDPILKNWHILHQVVLDLMLLENQIPFFVLHRMFIMTKAVDQPDDLISLIRDLVSHIYPWPGGGLKSRREAPEINNDADHLLDLMYKTWSSSFRSATPSMYGTLTLDKNSAAALREAGVKFEKGEETSNLLNIQYATNRLAIPPFVVNGDVESILRNLIVYEYIFDNNIRPKYVTDYVFFLQCLINSDKDVEILRSKGIMSNELGDDGMVHRMLKRLDRNVYVSPHKFSYGDDLDRINVHCRNHWNEKLANLKHDYFYSPWAYISFIAGFALLLMTLVQTVFAVLSYARDNP